MPQNRPPLPSSTAIPSALIEAWDDLPPEQRMNFHLRKADVESLLVAMQQLVLAQTSLQDTVVALSNNRLEEADESNDLARRHLIEAENHTRQFASSIMAAATTRYRV